MSLVFQKPIKDFPPGRVAESSKGKGDIRRPTRLYIIVLTLGVMVESIGIFNILTTNSGFDLEPPMLRADILLTFTALLSALILLYTELRRRSIPERDPP